MNIKTLGINLADLGEKLEREKSLGPQARDEIVKALTSIMETTKAEMLDLSTRQEAAFKSLIEAVSDTFDARTAALADAISADEIKEAA